MTGLYLSMLDSLAFLAEKIGRDADSKDLRHRHDAMAAALNALLWNEELGVYTNRHSETQAWVARISPFNFHPMLTGVASEAQARRMASEWLLNETGFCLGPGKSD